MQHILMEKLSSYCCPAHSLIYLVLLAGPRQQAVKLFSTPSGSISGSNTLVLSTSHALGAAHPVLWREKTPQVFTGNQGIQECQHNSP